MGQNIQSGVFHSGKIAIDAKFINVNTLHIVKSLGVPPNETDQYLLDIISEQVYYCTSICHPTGYYAVFQNPVFSGVTEELILNGQSFHLKKMVYSALKKSSHMVLFAVTAGPEIEKHSHRLMSERHSLEGLVADLVGSEIAESIANYIHQTIIKKMALEGLNTTNRYSPGYCGWNVSDQQQLFMLLGEENSGIHLTDSSLMIPIKSVSGIIGAGKEVQYQDYACSRCDADFCLCRDK